MDLVGIVMSLENIKKIGIIGVGFMGGSLALALKENYKRIEIIGYARSQASFERLKKEKIVDRIEKSKKKIAAESDILILATPVEVIIKHLKEISPFLKKGAIVVDIGSTKEQIQKQARALLPKKVFFVGCHPFCGSEKKGVEQSRGDLYQNSLCFITSENKASFVIEKMWKKIGSKVVRISPAVHDKIACTVSHLPHLICFALVNVVPDKYLDLSSSGFKDLTRIASSSDKLWVDIFLTNKDKILSSLDQYNKALIKFRNAIEGNDKQKLKKLINKANQKRNRIK